MRKPLTVIITLLSFIIMGADCQKERISDTRTDTRYPNAVILRGATVTSGSVTLEWTVNYDEDFLCYKIYRATRPEVTISSTSTLVAVISSRFTRDYTDVDVSPSTSYYYRVYVFNTRGNSTPSNEVLANVPAAVRPARYGDIRHNEIWSLRDSPIVISGDVTVLSDVKLEIEPGVIVEFKGSDRLVSGDYSSKSELVIRGTLIAAGTVERPIIFRSWSAIKNPGDWGHIKFENASGGSNNRLEYCKIVNATCGVRTTGTNISIINCQISENSDFGVFALDSSMYLYRTIVSNTSAPDAVCVYCECSAELFPQRYPYINDCLIAASSGKGIQLENAPVTVDHSIIIGCRAEGIYSNGADLNNIANTIIMDNLVNVRDASVEKKGAVQYCNVYHGGQYTNYTDFAGTSPGPGTISVNPKFISANFEKPEAGDWELAPDSPCRFAGRGGGDIGLQQPRKLGLR